MTLPALSGHVLEPVDTRDVALESLQERVTTLESEVVGLHATIESMNRENQRVIARLLSPLYKVLKTIYGEIEDVSDVTSTASNDSRWDVIKQRMAPRLREAIDLMLLQKNMRRTQLASALKMDYSNCNKNVIGPLLRQGWLVDNGGNLSLKQL